jgi:hypothetical protein
MSSEVIVDEATPEWCFGRWRRVVVHLWRAQLDAAKLAAGKRHSAHFKAALGGGYTFVVIFATDMGRFVPDVSEDARRGVVDMVRWSESWVSSAVGVVEGTGFMPAMIRAAGNGVAMLAKPKFPMKIVATVPEGARWLAGAERWAAGADAQLCAAVEAMRARTLALG